jgi:hypothetical protein
MKDQNNEKKKKFVDVKVEEGSASKILDGLTEAMAGVAKATVEGVRAAATVAGRTIDGAAQGIKQGMDQGGNLSQKVGKGVAGGIAGGMQGSVKGVKKASERLGDAVSDVGKGINKTGQGIKNTGEDIADLTGVEKKKTENQEDK